MIVWAVLRIAGSATALVAICPAAADRAHDDLDGKPEDDEVGDHLPGDQEPRRLGLGGDVAETDRGKHDDGEVQPVGMRQLRVEVAVPDGVQAADETRR